MDKILFTGGVGKYQKQADSEVAKLYALQQGVPALNIIVEVRSRYTFENIAEAKKIMRALDLKTALIVSDPLHMKRAMKLANMYGIDARSSPTKTSMYRTMLSQSKFLFYEVLYFTLREIKSCMVAVFFR